MSHSDMQVTSQDGRWSQVRDCIIPSPSESTLALRIIPPVGDLPIYCQYPHLAEPARYTTAAWTASYGQ